MSNLLRAELIKLRTTRTFIALAAAAVGTSILLAGLIALLSEPTREDVLGDVYMSDMTSLFIPILAIIGISGEWRHRTITSSLLAAPERIRFLASKTVAFALAGLALSLLVSLAVAIVGTAILELRGLPLPGFGEFLELVARNAGIAALLGAFGVGFGVLIRNQAVAIVSVLILAFVLEPVVLSVLPEIGQWGPMSALPTAILDVDAEAFGLEGNFVEPWPGVLGMLAWIGALFALGGTLLKRRDLE